MSNTPIFISEHIYFSSFFVNQTNEGFEYRALLTHNSTTNLYIHAQYFYRIFT